MEIKERYDPTNNRLADNEPDTVERAFEHDPRHVAPLHQSAPPNVLYPVANPRRVLPVGERGTAFGCPALTPSPLHTIVDKSIDRYPLTSAHGHAQTGRAEHQEDQAGERLDPGAARGGFWL